MTVKTFFHQKTVLVTGAAGFVGTHLVQRLAHAGARIIGTFHAAKPAFTHAAVNYIKADLTCRKDCLRAVRNAELVFHCAAATSGAAVINASPLSHVTPNIVMNACLLHAAYDAGVKKFLWLGSSTAYPPDDGHPVAEHEIMDGEPFEKYFCVGWMKRYTEVLCRTYGEKLTPPMTTIVLRPTNIYGPGDKFDPQRSHVLPALVRKVAEGHDPIEVWGTGDDERDLIYIDDMISAMLTAMEKITRYDAFNIGRGETTSVKDLLALIMQRLGREGAHVIFDPAKPSTIPRRSVDTSKAKRILGFTATTSLEKGLDQTIRWYLKESRRKKHHPRPATANAASIPAAK
jgi:GDP-L-fucose synthase